MKLGRLRGPVSAPAAPPGESWSLEVQIHPSDIRKRVRYLFLSRAQITAWSLLALLYLGGLALATAVAPGIVGGILNRDAHQGLAAERSRQGRRLQELIAELDQVERRADELNVRVQKIFLAYNLPVPAVRRKAGGPIPEEVDPKSIYARIIQHGGTVRARTQRRLDGVEDSLRQVTAFEGAHPEEVRTTPSICPLRSEFVFVSPFGNRRSPFTRVMEHHAGIDLAAPVETPVHAAADGVVAFAGEYPLGRSAVWWRHGNLVMVEHEAGFVTIYGHNQHIHVRQGQRVKRGDLLATVGKTGWSPNPHLHYEVRRKGADGVYRPVDPLIHILDRRWPNEERLLVRAQSARPLQDFEPLPSSVGK
ncbi:MAG TPA: M23 family metallopeptidase [Thermoanaerobaculia bacterium]